MLELKDVSYYYKSQKDKTILNHVTYQFKKGVMYAILGSSGSGKTTLLSLLAGLDVPVEGTVCVAGEDILQRGLNAHRKDHVSLVFQNYNLIDYLTPVENVKLGGKADAEELLAQMGIDEAQRKRNVMQLSGGQQQRVAIGRALISRPSLILADEPTGNLDTQNSSEVITLLKNASKRYAQTIIMITHNRSIAQTADRVLQVSDGVLTDLGRCSE